MCVSYNNFIDNKIVQIENNSNTAKSLKSKTATSSKKKQGPDRKQSEVSIRLDDLTRSLSELLDKSPDFEDMDEAKKNTSPLNPKLPSPQDFTPVGDMNFFFAIT